ncbi:hypothetical protein [Thermopirellula anaerolimosa]
MEVISAADRGLGPTEPMRLSLFLMTHLSYSEGRVQAPLWAADDRRRDVSGPHGPAVGSGVRNSQITRAGRFDCSPAILVCPYSPGVFGRRLKAIESPLRRDVPQ